MSRSKKAPAGGAPAGGSKPIRIERRKLSSITPADYNPRTISDVAMTGLKSSIKRFGLVVPLVLNEQTGNLVGGHQRLTALLDAGEKEADVVIVSLPPAEEKALNLALNNPGIMGEFTDAVADILAELRVEIPDAIDELRLDTISFDVPETDVSAEWEGMPEYEMNEVGPYRQLIISLRSEEDVQALGKLLGQKITPKTKSFWWPAAERDSTKDLCYVDDDEGAE